MHQVVSITDYGTASFGFLCNAQGCHTSWRIPNAEWHTWLAQIPFEHAQLIRFFTASSAAAELINDLKAPLLDRLPDPPLEPPPVDEPAPKSAYARLLEDSDE